MESITETSSKKSKKTLTLKTSDVKIRKQSLSTEKQVLIRRTTKKSKNRVQSAKSRKDSTPRMEDKPKKVPNSASKKLRNSSEKMGLRGNSSTLKNLIQSIPEVVQRSSKKISTSEMRQARQRLTNAQINDDLADIMIEPIAPVRKRNQSKTMTRSTKKYTTENFSTISYRDVEMPPIKHEDKFEAYEDNFNFVNLKKSYEKPKETIKMSETIIMQEIQPNPIVVKDMLNLMPTPKKPQKQWIFYVYKGNYPHQIENALIKRGVWKYFDKHSVAKKSTTANILDPKSMLDLETIHNIALKNIQQFESELLAAANEPPSQQKIDEAIIEKCHFIWKPFNFYDKESQKRIEKRLLRSNGQNQLIFNHFECLKSIGTKSGLIRSLRHYYYQNIQAKQCGYTEFDTTPTTFLIQARVKDEKQQELIQRYLQISKGFAPKERLPMKHCQKNLWLVKPTNMNQGRGIQIFSELDKMLGFINSRPTGTLCVVQKYLEKPLLYKQRKFDIRIWAVMNCKNEIYFYKKGYIRTSSSKYNLDDSNQYIHLTNQCLQIQNKEEYGSFEEGNTLTFEQFQRYLDSEEFKQERPDLNLNKENRIIVERDIVQRMKDIVIDTLCAVKYQVNPNHRKNHFELFGYDFMIDEDFRVWLIEVNSNPYIGTPNQEIKEMVPQMIDEMLEICLDPFYPPSLEYYQRKQKTTKEFELIYRESTIQSPYKIMNEALLINHRRPFNHSLMYPLEWLKNNFKIKKGVYSNHVQTEEKNELKALRQKYRNLDLTQKSPISTKRVKGIKSNLYTDILLQAAKEIDGMKKRKKGPKKHTRRSKTGVKVLSEGKLEAEEPRFDVNASLTVRELNENIFRQKYEYRSKSFQKEMMTENPQSEGVQEDEPHSENENLQENYGEIDENKDIKIQHLKDKIGPSQVIDDFGSPAGSDKNLQIPSEYILTSGNENNIEQIEIPIIEPPNNPLDSIDLSSAILAENVEETPIVQIQHNQSAKETTKPTKKKIGTNHLRSTISSMVKNDVKVEKIQTPVSEKPKKHKLIVKPGVNSNLNTKMQEFCNYQKKRSSIQFQEIFSEVTSKILNSEDIDRDRLSNRFQLFLEQDDKKICQKPQNLDEILAILTQQNLLQYSRMRKVLIEHLIKMSESSQEARNHLQDNLDKLIKIHQYEINTMFQQNKDNYYNPKKKIAGVRGVSGFVSALNIDSIDSKLKIERIIINISGFLELKLGKKRKLDNMAELFKKSLNNGLVIYLLQKCCSQDTSEKIISNLNAQEMYELIKVCKEKNEMQIHEKLIGILKKDQRKSKVRANTAVRTAGEYRASLFNKRAFLQPQESPVKEIKWEKNKVEIVEFKTPQIGHGEKISALDLKYQEKIKKNVIITDNKFKKFIQPQKYHSQIMPPNGKVKKYLKNLNNEEAQYDYLKAIQTIDSNCGQFQGQEGFRNPYLQKNEIIDQ